MKIWDSVYILLLFYLVPLIRDKSSSSRAFTPDSSTPSSRKMERGEATGVVDGGFPVVEELVEAIVELFVEANVERCVENVEVVERNVVCVDGADRRVVVGIFVSSMSES